MNALYYGDNLDVLRKHVADESVDLVYLDPPFNSNRSYNVLFKGKSGDEAQAQIEAFDDTWTWSQQSESTYTELVQGGAPLKVADALEAMRRLLGDNDVLAYLVMMAARLVELHEVLKPTGSLYLHCDPTASHYLKVMLDAIFSPVRFQNEITWQRAGAKNDPKRYGRIHDVIFFYTKGQAFTWHDQFTPFNEASIQKNYTMVEAGSGRRYRHSDLTAAKPGGDVDFEWQGVRPYKGRHWAYSRANLDAMFAEGRIEFRRTGSAAAGCLDGHPPHLRGCRAPRLPDPEACCPPPANPPGLIEPGRRRARPLLRLRHHHRRRREAWPTVDRNRHHLPRHRPDRQAPSPHLRRFDRYHLQSPRHPARRRRGSGPVRGQSVRL
jgi:hypothetical protein